MYLNWISLGILIITIVVGVMKKWNVGILAVAMAFILGKIGGISESDILSGFNSSLFLMLLGVMFLFGVAQTNGTMELFAKKVIALVGHRAFLVPWIIYLVSVIISAIGPGSLATLVLVSVLAVSLAKEIKVSPLLMAAMAFFGTCVGGVSPIASDGIIAGTLATEQGVEGLPGMTFFITALIGVTIIVICLYFKLGGHKIRLDTTVETEKLPAFNLAQKLTLLGIVALVIITLVLGFNVGLTAFVIAIVLLLFRAGDEKKVLGSIGWSTLILVTGFSVLMNVITQLGGIALLSNLLSQLMTKTLAPFVMSLSSSILGMVCSVSGVVMPTMISAVPDIIANIGADHRELIVAVVTGSHVGGITPITGGALLLSAYVTICKPTEQEQRKFYVNLFLMAFFAAGRYGSAWPDRTVWNLLKYMP